MDDGATFHVEGFAFAENDLAGFVHLAALKVANLGIAFRWPVFFRTVGEGGKRTIQVDIYLHAEVAISNTGKDLPSTFAS